MDKLTVWAVYGDASAAVNWADGYGQPVLKMGTALNAMAEITGAIAAVSKATYASGANYQATGGAFRQLWRIDFKNVGFTTGGGQVFFAAYAPPKAPVQYFFAHASNGALSGSQQTDADGLL